jgi:hypothetical protein
MVKGVLTIFVRIFGESRPNPCHALESQLFGFQEDMTLAANGTDVAPKLMSISQRRPYKPNHVHPQD